MRMQPRPPHETASDHEQPQQLDQPAPPATAAGPSTATTVPPPSLARRAIHRAATFCRKRRGATATAEPEPRQEAQPHPESEDLDEHGEFCRICLESEADGDGVLYRPCDCRGSMAWVHVECLSRWRRVSANPRSFLYCDQCNYEYQLSEHSYGIAASWMACGVAVQQFGVWALYSDLALPCYLLGGALMLLGAHSFDRSSGHSNEWNVPLQTSTVVGLALVLMWIVTFILGADSHLGSFVSVDQSVADFYIYPDSIYIGYISYQDIYPFLVRIAPIWIAALAISCCEEDEEHAHRKQPSRNKFWLMICLHAIIVGLQAKHTAAECPLYYRPTTPPPPLISHVSGAPLPPPPPPPPPPLSSSQWHPEYTRSMTYGYYEPRKGHFISKGLRATAATPMETLERDTRPQGWYEEQAADAELLFRQVAEPLVREIFERYDANGDGKLSQAEYRSYLQGIGAWGKGSYTDEKWDEKWPLECSNLLGCDSAAGVTWEAFAGKLYVLAHRASKVEADLSAVRAHTEAAAGHPQSDRTTAARLDTPPDRQERTAAVAAARQALDKARRDLESRKQKMIFKQHGSCNDPTVGDAFGGFCHPSRVDFLWKNTQPNTNNFDHTRLRLSN